MHTRKISNLIQRSLCIVFVIMAMTVMSSNPVLAPVVTQAKAISRPIQRIPDVPTLSYSEAGVALSTASIYYMITSPMSDYQDTAVYMASLVTDEMVSCGHTENQYTEPEEPPVSVEELEPPPVEQTEPAPTAPIEPVEETPAEPMYDFSSVPLPDAHMQALVDACGEHGIPIAIGLGLIDVESDFVEDPGGDFMGYCQLHPKYFPHGLTPEENIWHGMKYLGEKYQETCDWYLALNAYNAGHVTGDMTYANAVMSDAMKWSEKTGAPTS